MLLDLNSRTRVWRQATIESPARFPLLKCYQVAMKVNIRAGDAVFDTVYIRFVLIVDNCKKRKKKTRQFVVHYTEFSFLIGFFPTKINPIIRLSLAQPCLDASITAHEKQGKLFIFWKPFFPYGIWIIRFGSLKLKYMTSVSWSVDNPEQNSLMFGMRGILS